MSENKFAVKVKTEYEMVFLSITHNGSDWSSIHIKNPDIEIPEIIEALENYLFDDLSN